MAVDKKSDYVGNHEGRYIDNDGQTKQFTYIDMDKKTKKSNHISSAEEAENRKQWLANFYEMRIKEVLAMPAVSITGLENGMCEHLIIRDKEKGIIWHEEALRQSMLADTYLAYSISMLIWKRTVREVHWFDPMREDHEAILRGDWKSLM